MDIGITSAGFAGKRAVKYERKIRTNNDITLQRRIRQLSGIKRNIFLEKNDVV